MSSRHHKSHDKCQCPKCKKKSKEKPCPPPEDCCPEVKIECCEPVMELGRVKQLAATPEPILMVNANHNSSCRRTLEIEACASAFATAEVPTFANVRLELDGNLLGHEVAISLEELFDDAARPCASRVCLKETVDVGPGLHTVALVAFSAQGGANLEPSSGGCPCTFLKVCVRACDCCCENKEH